MIWGCKQQDPEALNAFHPLSYEGAIGNSVICYISLEDHLSVWKIWTKLLMIWRGRPLLVSFITVSAHNCRLLLNIYPNLVGQTPRKLFTTPHPTRYNHGLSTLPLGTLHGIEEDSHLLTQGPRCFRGWSALLLLGPL